MFLISFGLDFVQCHTHPMGIANVSIGYSVPLKSISNLSKMVSVILIAAMKLPNGNARF